MSQGQMIDLGTQKLSRSVHHWSPSSSYHERCDAIWWIDLTECEIHACMMWTSSCRTVSYNDLSAEMSDGSEERWSLRWKTKRRERIGLLSRPTFNRLDPVVLSGDFALGRVLLETTRERVSSSYCVQRSQQNPGYVRMELARGWS